MIALSGVMLLAMTLGSGQQVALPVRRVSLVRGPWWTLAAGAGVLAAVGAAVLLAAGVEMAIPEGRLAPWRWDVMLALMLAAAVSLVLGAVRAMRAGVVASSGWVGGAPATRAQRARALGAVRRCRAVGGGEQALTAAVARAAIGESASALVWVAMTLSILAGALGMAPSWWQALSVLAVASLGAMTAITVSDARRAERWLQAHHPSVGSWR